VSLNTRVCELTVGFYAPLSSKSFGACDPDEWILANGVISISARGGLHAHWNQGGRCCWWWCFLRRMRRFFAFWWFCVRQAFWGNSFLESEWRWAFGNAMSALLVPGALAAVSGTAAWIIGSSIVDIFLTALVAFVIAWTVGFLIRLSSLPPEYYYRQVERADRLENEQKQAKAKLWELRETGVALRNNGRKLIDETEVAEWTKEFEAWYKAILENALFYSSDLRHALDPLDKIALENRELVNAPHIKNHELYVSVTSEILARLFKFLNREI
jgi:hypothetical protein